MIAEEAAYMPLSVFYEIVVPLLEMEKSVLLMISTPVDSFNFFSQVIDYSRSTIVDRPRPTTCITSV